MGINSAIVIDSAIDYESVLRKEREKAFRAKVGPPLEIMLEFQRTLIDSFLTTNNSNLVSVRKSLPEDIILLHRTCTMLGLSSAEGDLLLETFKGVLKNNKVTGVHLPKHIRSATEACQKHLASIPFQLFRRLYPLPEEFFGRSDKNPREGTYFDIIQTIGDGLLWANPENIELEAKPFYQEVNGCPTRVYKSFMSCELAGNCSTWLKKNMVQTLIHCLSA